MPIHEPRRSSLEYITPNIQLPQPGERIEEIPIEAITPNRWQVRTHFALEAITELADSIRTHGLQSPLVVRPADKSLTVRLSDPGVKFELISGERRLRALKHLGKRTAPVIVRAIDDTKMRTLALVENVQREDLSLLEKAKALLDLKNELGNLEKVAEAIHKSRSHTFKLARIGELDAEYQDLIAKSSVGVREADQLADLVKDVEKKGNPKLEYSVKRALLGRTLDAGSIRQIRDRFLREGDRPQKSKGKPDPSFWKTKKEIGLKFRVPQANVGDPRTKAHLVEEATRFFQALGARKVQIVF